jgi:polysaccharide pyruvyl transferase CsaB
VQTQQQTQKDACNSAEWAVEAENIVIYFWRPSYCLGFFVTYSIGISGSYGGLNMGDEAILQSIITQLRASVPAKITIFSRNAEDTRRRHKIENAVQPRELTLTEVTPEIENLDLFILGGGGILFDSEADIFMREVEVATEHGIPTMLYAIGAGPINNEITRKKVKNALSKVDLITVRDRDAKKILESIGVKCPIIETADPALLLDPEPLPPDALKNEQIHPDRHLIGVSVREPGPAAPDINPHFYHAVLANAADFVVSRLNTDVIFVPMERQVLDVQNAHAVISRMLKAQNASVLKGEYSPGQLLSFMKHFDFAIGMRLHFLIFAALQQVPFVALPYASKVGGFLAHLQVPMPPLSKIDSGLVNAIVDKAWDEKKLVNEKIQRLLPDLQNLARENNRLAIELLKGK